MNSCRIVFYRLFITTFNTFFVLSNLVHKIQIRSLTDFLHLYIYETNPSQRHYRSFPDTVSISYTRIQSRQSLLTLNVGHARRRFLGKTIVSVHGLKAEYTPQSPQLHTQRPHRCITRRWLLYYFFSRLLQLVPLDP